MKRLFRGIRRRLTGQSRDLAQNRSSTPHQTPPHQTPGRPRFMRSLSCIQHDSYSSPIFRRSVSSGLTPPREISTPEPERERVLLINTDATWCTKLQTWYGDVFIHDSDFEIIAARCFVKNKYDLKYSLDAESSFEGETFAVQKGVDMVCNLDLSKYSMIHFMCDHESLCMELNRDTMKHSGALVVEVRALREKLASLRQSVGVEVKLTFQGRDDNQIAHTLGMYARRDGRKHMVRAANPIDTYSTAWNYEEGMEADVAKVYTLMPREMQLKFDANRGGRTRSNRI